MNTARFGGAAALAKANDSSQGKAKVTPVALRKVRRLVFMSIGLRRAPASPFWITSFVSKYRALDDLVDHRTNGITIGFEVFDNSVDFRAVGELDSSTGGILDEV